LIWTELIATTIEGGTVALPFVKGELMSVGTISSQYFYERRVSQLPVSYHTN